MRAVLKARQGRLFSEYDLEHRGQDLTMNPFVREVRLTVVCLVLAVLGW